MRFMYARRSSTALRCWRSDCRSSDSRLEERFSRSYAGCVSMRLDRNKGETYSVEDEFKNVTINVSSSSIIFHDR